MSDFYDLSDDQKEAHFCSLVQAALPLWGMEGSSVELIKQRENAVFKLTGADGSRAVMRVHRAGYHSDAELHSELQWMSALDAAGIRTPRVIPATDGEPIKTVEVSSVPEPRQVDVLAWVEGKTAGAIEGGIEDIDAARNTFRMIGQLMARMHQFTADWDEPVGFTRHAWDREGLLGENPWWGRFWEVVLLDDAQRNRLQQARTLVAEELDNYGSGSDRYGLVHADTLPENFLVDDSGEVRVIDFDDGGYGWFLFDFATTLFFHLGEAYFDDILASLVAGYTEIRELPPQFEEMLPVFLMLRSFTYLGWVHTRDSTDIAQAMGPVIVEGAMALVDDYLTSQQKLHHV